LNFFIRSSAAHRFINGQSGRRLGATARRAVNSTRWKLGSNSPNREQDGVGQLVKRLRCGSARFIGAFIELAFGRARPHAIVFDRGLADISLSGSALKNERCDCREFDQDQSFVGFAAAL